MGETLNIMAGTFALAVMVRFGWEVGGWFVRKMSRTVRP